MSPSRAGQPESHKESRVSSRTLAPEPSAGHASGDTVTGGNRDLREQQEGRGGQGKARGGHRSPVPSAVTETASHAVTRACSSHSNSLAHG